MQTSLSLYEQADAIDALLSRLQQRVKDIKQTSGEEVYAASRAAYKLFENANNAGIPNAKTAYEILRQRFSKAGRESEDIL